MGKIYIGDIGTRLRTILNANLAGYSSINYKIKKPSGNILTKTCSVEDESKGIIYYDTILNDLDELGTYLVQTDITFTNGNKNKSETTIFTVHNLYK